MKKKSVNIFIATHKSFDFPYPSCYIPLHVGATGKKDLGYQKDNTKDNISSKNSSFCELTGMYWIWKNSISDIVGLVHYRRYFFYKQNGMYILLTEEKIKDIMLNYDVIVPKKVKIITHNVKNQYKALHHIEDFEICADIIKELYPDYVDSFNEVSKRKWLYPYNMCILSKENYDKYCKWLFDILFELEKRVSIDEYDNYNKRIFGFLSERLFNVWLNKNSNLKIKEFNVYNVDQNLNKQIIINGIKDIIVR